MSALAWIRGSALFFCIITVGLAALSFWIASARDPFSALVNMNPGFASAGSFRVARKARYVIEVRIRRTGPSQDLEELMQGGNVVYVELYQDDAPAGLTYLREDAPGMGMGSNYVGFARDWISQQLATFVGNPKSSYSLRYTVLRPVRSIVADEGKPTIVVSPDPLDIKSDSVTSGLLAGLAVLCGAIWLTLTGLYLNILRKRRRAAPI